MTIVSASLPVPKLGDADIVDLDDIPLGHESEIRFSWMSDTGRIEGANRLTVNHHLNILTH